VDLDELYDYVCDRVSAATPHQTPHIWGARQGKVVIASVPLTARIKAIGAPAHLTGQASDPAAAVRLGAVSDLRRVLLGEDVERAAGVLDLLRELGRDDSRQVSFAAQSALDEAQLKAVPDQLDLGAGQPGQPREAQTVRLAGPPLAQVFQADTNTRWLRLDRSVPSRSAVAWVRATVDTGVLPDGQGQMNGSISVVNLLGRLEIPVTARVTKRSGATNPHPIQEAWALPGWAWASSHAALAFAGAGIMVGALGTGLAAAGGPSEIGASGGLGAGYYVIRFALPAAAIVLIGTQGRWRAAGAGIAAASTAFFLTDAVGWIHHGGMSWAWVELLAVIIFASLLVIRLRPYAAKLSPLRIISPADRPLAFVALAMAGAQFILLFKSFLGAAIFDGTPIPQSTSIDGINGTASALLAVVPIAGLCVTVALTGLAGELQRAFAAAAIIAYLGPELYFMLGSLISGTSFAYIGDDAWTPGQFANWFVFLQATVTAALAVSTLLLLRSTGPGAVTRTARAPR
jgi:hypothetical protein